MTYRGEGDGWILKRESLVRALTMEADLDVREKIAAELATFDRARRIEARKRLPVVAGAAIASPCHETFEAMSGEGAIRSCARCDQEVFDLAQMTLAQAEALIASRDGASTCVRLRKRRDGTMMFADCEVGARGVRTRRVGLAVAAAVIASTAIAWIASPPVHVHALRSAPRAHPSRPGAGVHYGAPPAPAPFFGSSPYWSPQREDPATALGGFVVSSSALRRGMTGS